MGRKYSNPPVAEVVCELRFEGSQQWDLTFPGLIYEKVSTLFPARKTRRLFQGTAYPDLQGIQHELSLTELAQFWSPDETAFIQVGPDLLSINQLKPYPTWEMYKPKIDSTLASYVEVVRPSALLRIGLRYINHIRIPESSIELIDYFQYYPAISPAMPQPLEKFVVISEFPYRTDQDNMRIRFGTAESEEPSTVECVLDIDYYLQKPFSINLGDAVQWLEDAHSNIEAAFEACLTERTRTLFY